MNESASHVSDPGGTENNPSFLARLKSAWEMEFSNLRWRVLFGVLLARLIPEERVAALRTVLVRVIGLRIGPSTRFKGMPKIQSLQPAPLRTKLVVGSHCVIGTRVILEFGELLTIGDRVTLADGVVILTTTHQLGPKEHRCGPVVRNPVVIGNDVVIGTDAIILPGASIGDGARILPNSVVNASVAPGVTVSGIPARPLRAS